MNTNQIIRILCDLTIELKELISTTGINKTSEITGLKYQDIQAFLKDRRKWSYEKVLKIAKKMTIGVR